MHDAVPVRVIERGRDFRGVPQGLIERQRAAREARRQRLAFEVLHDEKDGAVGLADVVQRTDVRVIERGDGPGLPGEPGSQLRVVRPCGSTLIATVRFSRVSVAR